MANSSTFDTGDSLSFISAKILARSKFTFTYSITPTLTDWGFGCMLRSIQMLLADTLRRESVESREQKWLALFTENTLPLSLLKDPQYIEMISHFSEGREGMCSLSQLIKVGEIFGVDKRSWYSPRVACLIVSEIINNQHERLRIHVAKERTIFQIELLSLFEEGKKKDKVNDYSILLLVPCRLGADAIEENLHTDIIRQMRSRFCVGLLGGPGSRGLYCFATTETDTLLCLDPHNAVRVEIGEGSSPESEEFLRCTHTDTNMQEIRVDELNPELAFGFYFKDKHELKEWFTENIVHPEKELSAWSSAFSLMPGSDPAPSVYSEDGISLNDEDEEDWKIL